MGMIRKIRALFHRDQLTRWNGCVKFEMATVNDNLGSGFGGFLRAACENLLSVTKGAVYVCMSSSELDTLKTAFEQSGGHWSTFVIWAKNTFTLGRSDYQRQYEPILYGWKEGTDHFWCGVRDQGDVWFVNKLERCLSPVQIVLVPADLSAITTEHQRVQPISLYSSSEKT